VDGLLAAGQVPAPARGDASRGGWAGGGAPRLSAIGSAGRCAAAPPNPTPQPPARTFEVQLGPILPNPAQGPCDLHFTLAAAATVTISIYDVHGRLVRELVSGPFGTGEHEIAWDRCDAAGMASRTGVYFARLRAGEVNRSARIFVVR
jgi:hypothetical protein